MRSKAACIAGMIALWLGLATGCAYSNKTSTASTIVLEAKGLPLMAAAPVINGALGSHLSEFDVKSEGRANNIKVASQSINGAVIEPGETFSYNETVGPTTKKNGYKLGKIFVRGKKSEGYGGGVCQVSSTLYNAAEKAGMEIVERHHHSLPVNYVEKGKDAATSYGVIDFKFANTKEYPVMIQSNVNENQLVVEIVPA